MVKYFKGQNSPINELEGDINADSDCEGGLTGADEVTLKWEEQEEESRAVLTAGSFSAYVYFLSHPLAERNDGVLQLEISFLLSLYRHDLVRSPPITRSPLSLELYPREDCGHRTASLLAEEHLRVGKVGEGTSD